MTINLKYKLAYVSAHKVNNTGIYKIFSSNTSYLALAILTVTGWEVLDAVKICFLTRRLIVLYTRRTNVVKICFITRQSIVLYIRRTDIVSNSTTLGRCKGVFKYRYYSTCIKVIDFWPMADQPKHLTRYRMSECRPVIWRRDGSAEIFFGVWLRRLFVGRWMTIYSLNQTGQRASGIHGVRSQAFVNKLLEVNLESLDVLKYCITVIMVKWIDVGVDEIAVKMSKF
jgi:hypothetical protein